MSPLLPPGVSEMHDLSIELRDAGAELLCRIELGEFDDLDEAALAEVSGLGAALRRWAERVGAFAPATSSPQKETLAAARRLESAGPTSVH